MKGIMKAFSSYPTEQDINLMRKRYKAKFCFDSKYIEISGMFNNYSVRVY